MIFVSSHAGFSVGNPVSCSILPSRSKLGLEHLLLFWKLDSDAKEVSYFK